VSRGFRRERLPAANKLRTDRAGRRDVTPKAFPMV